MKKHKFNIFPEAKPEDYSRLRDDISANGYDAKQPVTLYQGEVLDGWNRTRACVEIGIEPPTVNFHGTDAEAIALVMRTNKRRNLNSGQWACIAAEADDLLAVIREGVEKERREKQAEAQAVKHEMLSNTPKASDLSDKKLSDSHANTTPTKAAELFNTNRTYVNQAVKMKTAAPEVFEKVKAGQMTMQDANKAVRAIPVDPWSEDEKQRREHAESGKAVIANQQRDKNLIQWAEKAGKAVRVDRGSVFGNPFVLGVDGDRDAVCDAYANHYVPFKPSILKLIPSLNGKVLICHCYPERCHAQTLIDSL